MTVCMEVSCDRVEPKRRRFKHAHARSESRPGATMRPHLKVRSGCSDGAPSLNWHSRHVKADALPASVTGVGRSWDQREPGIPFALGKAWEAGEADGPRHLQGG